MANAKITEQEVKMVKSHMNKDHAESLSYYLRFYHDVPWYEAEEKPEITFFSSEKMTIEYGFETRRKTWDMVFDPPMKPLEARKRLVTMHDEARNGLGLSEVKIDDFYVSGVGIAFCIIIPLVMGALIYMRPSKLIKLFPSLASAIFKLGSANFWTKLVGGPLLDPESPNLTHLAWAIRGLFLSIIIITHIKEMIVDLSPLLYRYSINNPDIRNAYLFAVFVAGFPIHKHLRAVGAQKEAILREEKKKKIESGKHE